MAVGCSCGVILERSVASFTKSISVSMSASLSSGRPMDDVCLPRCGRAMRAASTPVMPRCWAS